MTTRRWHLYVDESGPGDGGAAFAVGGVLLPAGSRAGCPYTVRQALERAAPGVPWPLHGWLLRRPAAHAVWAAARGEAPDPRVEPALALLREHAAEDLAAAVARVEAGHEPQADELAALQIVLRRRDSDALRRLEAWTDRVRAQVYGVARALGQEGVVAAAAAQASPDEPVHPQLPDVYRGLLTRLFERITDALLRHGDGHHQVDLFVLRRYVEDDTVGQEINLRVEHLGEAAAAATGSAERRRQLGRRAVRLNPGKARAWDATVPAQYVLADLVAHFTRPYLVYGNRPLASAREPVEQVLGLPLALELEGGVQLTATGLAADFLDRLRQDAGAPRELHHRPGLRRWAREQANAWAARIAEGG